MNRTKIEWTDYSWNPITGCRGRTGKPCWYCYAERLAKRFPKIFPNGFEPTFYPNRLREPWKLKKPSKIFVCSIADLFAPWTNPEWRNLVITAMLQCPVKHQFQLLTKHPERIRKNGITLTIPYPQNWWFGTTVTSEEEDEKNIDAIKRVKAAIRFVSFEPLLGRIDFKKHSLEGIQWVIIGKLTGSKKVKLNREWVKDIIMECYRRKIPYFTKNNLGWKVPVHDFPRGHNP